MNRQKKIAILATNGFEKSELFKPLKQLKEKGFDVEVVSEKEGSIKSWSDGDWSDEVEVDQILSEVDGERYDALILPGGVINPDLLRVNTKAIDLIKSFFSKGKEKLVAAICHAPILLAEADLLKGRTVTSYKSIKKDLINAGASWEDHPCVVDKNLITSRSPKDLAEFISRITEKLNDGLQDRYIA